MTTLLTPSPHHPITHSRLEALISERAAELRPLVAEDRELWLSRRAATVALRDHRLMLGAKLIAARFGVSNETYGKILVACGIHQRTAHNARRLAEEFCDWTGKIDLEKVRARREANAGLLKLTANGQELLRADPDHLTIEQLIKIMRPGKKRGIQHVHAGRPEESLAGRNAHADRQEEAPEPHRLEAGATGGVDGGTDGAGVLAAGLGDASSAAGARALWGEALSEGTEARSHEGAEGGMEAGATGATDFPRRGAPLTGAQLELDFDGLAARVRRALEVYGQERVLSMDRELDQAVVESLDRILSLLQGRAA